MIEILGFLGTIFLILSSVPQTYLTWKTKKTEGLSLSMLLFWFFGVFFMGIYVVLTTCQIPLLLNYGFNTVVIGLNLYFYYKYRNTKSPNRILRLVRRPTQEQNSKK